MEAKADSVGLGTALRRIAALGLLEREAEIEDGITVRLESADFPTNEVRGEIIRRQMANLPPKALSGQRIERLGVEAIGHSTAFLYYPRLSILAFEQARNGITSTRFGLYIAHFAGSARYDILPVPTHEMWETLRTGRLRAIRVRCSAPQSLEVADAEAETVKRGLVSLQGALNTHYVDATLGMKRGDPDIQRNGAIRWFNWFRRERENHRGEITHVYADIIPEGETQTAHLNLLRGQIGGQRRLDLPEDTPEASYRIRESFLTEVFHRHEQELEERYHP